MVKTEDILLSVQSVVNNNTNFAIIWHGLFYLLIIALILRWEPSNRILSVALCLPLLSVAVFAWIGGNPFNGTTFLLASGLMLFFGLKAGTSAITFSQLPFMAAGVLMIFFGLIYPHFVQANSVIEYFYESPAGLIPCPTLSIIIGFILLYNGFGSAPIMLTFIIFGLFYGLFGIFRLGVHLDVYLLLGAVALLIKYILALKATPAIAS